MNKVTCVWQESLKYPKVYVEKMHSMLKRYGCELEVISPNWLPGWWAKMELFNLPAPIRYLDLDTVICGPIDFLFDPCPNMKMLWEIGENGELANSSIMGWDEDHKWIFDEFMKDPNGNMAKYKGLPKIGDQAFIYDTIQKEGKTVDFWDSSKLVHFRNVLWHGADWGNASICHWTAQPKPLSMTGHQLVKEHWR